MGKFDECLSLTIPNHMRYLPLILDSTGAYARMLGLDDKQIRDVTLGVEEAVVNVLEHAFDEGEQASFELVFQQVPLGMQILIRDQGMPFDPQELAKMADAAFFGEDTRGLGLYLMYRFMDEVSFVNLGKNGKETRLLKYLGRIPEAFVASPSEAEHPQENIPSYQIRRMLPHEAVEVSKCAYMSYGYSYANEHVYYPERLRQLNEEGKMVSFVAVTDSGEIIGHVALIFDDSDPLVPVSDDAFVKPQYRGAGCLNDLGRALVQWATDHAILGSYALAVTSHPYSQKVASRWGYHDTAIYISIDTPFDFKAIKEEAGQRESETLLFRYFRPSRNVNIYAPARHAGMITQIYQHQGVNTTVLSPAPDLQLPAEEAVIEVKYDPSIIAYIKVKQYGHQITSEINRILKGLCIQRTETIYLYLPLNNPFTSLLTSDFEALGFFFCGIMPGSEGRDQLILQYLNNQIIDYRQLCMHSQMGQKLLAYIQQHDPNQSLQAE
ncbi:MAG TPA: GNAT family N-acetyltransferase [Syntrophomonas sp.]|nr:GNAT family N-acetyltransferase [Syntrophomonas sp.]